MLIPPTWVEDYARMRAAELARPTPSEIAKTLHTLERDAASLRGILTAGTSCYGVEREALSFVRAALRDAENMGEPTELEADLLTLERAAGKAKSFLPSRRFANSAARQAAWRVVCFLKKQGKRITISEKSQSTLLLLRVARAAGDGSLTAGAARQLIGREINHPIWGE